MVLESCFEGERVNLANLDGSPTPYFYLHLHVIHDLGGLDSFHVV